jgi:E3 ubiquitin-protein ligase RNF13
MLAMIIAILLLSCQIASATVVVQIDSFTFDALSDVPASFGPEIPTEGLSGLLVIAEPASACSPLKIPDFIEELSQPWVALISRSQGESDDCTFDVKVRNAENAGAAAAIVYDDIYENLIIMAKPASHPDPTISSVFISQKSGMLLQKLYAPGYTQVYISAMSDMVWMSMIISTLAGFFAVSVVVTAFYLARRPVAGMEGDDDEEEGVGAGGGASGTRPRRRQGLNAEQLRLLPVIVHQAEDASSGNDESSSSPTVTRAAATASSGAPGDWHTAGDTKRVCAICLELYEPNDKLRLLPCQHRYHKECVDQWLTTRKPFCPVCKTDASTLTAAMAQQQQEGVDLEAGGTSASESARSWVLRSGNEACENIRRAAQRVLESRFLTTWARPNNNSGNSGSGAGGAQNSGEEARVRLLPLADSSQRGGSSASIATAVEIEPSTSSSANV